MTTSRVSTAARVSVTALTREFAGARCIPSDRTANQVCKVIVVNNYFIRRRIKFVDKILDHER